MYFITTSHADGTTFEGRRRDPAEAKRLAHEVAAANPAATVELSAGAEGAQTARVYATIENGEYSEAFEAYYTSLDAQGRGHGYPSLDR